MFRTLIAAIFAFTLIITAGTSVQAQMPSDPEIDRAWDAFLDDDDPEALGGVATRGKRR